jgi:two-component system response regulator QseB
MILYAEDDAAVGKAYTVGLTLAGFDVTHVDDGDQALARLESGHFDLFLLDLYMPGMDGFEILRRLSHSATLRRHTPVVVILSADDTRETMETVFELGAISCLPKSEYTPARLARRLRQWIEESAGRSA